jgi:hypothetical protein
MNRERVVELLSRFTYKPNWVIEVMPRDPSLPFHDQPVYLYLTQYVEDSRDQFRPWDFRIRETFSFEMQEICLRPDRMGYAYSPERRIFPVGGRVRVPRIADDREDRFWTWLHDVAIPDLERHEISEWFKVDGKLWRDPHAS